MAATITISENQDFNIGDQNGPIGHIDVDSSDQIHVITQSYQCNDDFHCIYRSPKRKEISTLSFAETGMKNNNKTLLQFHTVCNDSYNVHLDLTFTKYCWCDQKLDIVYEIGLEDALQTTVHLDADNLRENGFELYVVENRFKISDHYIRAKSLFLAVQGNNGVRYIDLENTNIKIVDSSKPVTNNTFDWLDIEIDRSSNAFSQDTHTCNWLNEKTNPMQPSCAHSTSVCYDCSPLAMQKRLNQILSE